jgi:anti-sigma-K factor RskA
MTYDPKTYDPPSSRAGEYVLGTLRGTERDAFESDLAHDPQLQTEVQAWERRLSPLADMTAPEQPSPTVWAAIERQLDQQTTTGLPAGAGPNVVRLQRKVRIWQGFSAASGALAACLALFIVLAGRLPGTDMAQEYVAVVNRGGDLPALIVRVDTREGVVRVRSLTAEAPADRSLELWYVHAGQAPKSLGIVDNAARPMAIPVSLRHHNIEDAKIAVTLEPRGGSPTAAPTGPVVYSGQLIKE